MAWIWEQLGWPRFDGPEGFEGGLRAGKYASITGASAATATRDLAELVAIGALVRTGERRHARYHPPVPLRPVAEVTIDRAGRLEPLVADSAP